MNNPLTTQHHYNICERDSEGTLWVIANNYTRRRVFEFLITEDTSVYNEIVVVKVETNTFDVSFEFFGE